MNETTASTAITLLETCFSDISDTLLQGIATVLPTAIPVAATLLVIAVGWKLFKKFTK